MAVGVTRDHHSHPQSLRASRERGQQRPTLKALAGWIVAQWDEVIENPGMFDDGDAICFKPDSQYILICSVLWCCFYTEAQVLFC